MTGPRARSRPHAPRCVQNAVRLMIARAAGGLVSIVVALLTRGELRGRLTADDATGTARHLADVQIAITVSIGALILVGYVLLARQVRIGRYWARLVTWVLAGIGVLSSFADAATPLSRVLYLLLGAVDLAIIVLLALPDSDRWFRRRAERAV